MRVKLYLLIVSVFICSLITSAQQSIYYFKYHFPDDADGIVYQAFLVRYEDGTGFIRVNYTDSETHKNYVVDMQMEDGYEISKNGKTDSTKMYFEGYDPVIIRGDTAEGYDPDVFWFRLDEESGYFVPWDIISTDENGEHHIGEYLDNKLLNEKDLTKDFIAQFFNEHEGLYENADEMATTRSLSGDEKKTKMYLLIAANTLDDEIGTTCEVDRKGTEKIFTELADFMGIQLISKSIYDREYNKKNVETAIESLNPGAKDIVVFYYSGHGFSQNDRYIYPHIALTSKISESATANSLNMEDIFNRIKRKGARFNLVLSDCCNTPIGKPAITVPIEYARTRSSQVGWDLDNCKSLFLNPKPTSILMTAASRDEFSCGIRDGGLFTITLRSALADYFSKLRNNVTWGEILADVKNQTIKRADHTARSDKGPDGKNLRCKQHPVFQVLVDQ